MYFPTRQESYLSIKKYHQVDTYLIKAHYCDGHYEVLKGGLLKLRTIVDLIRCL